MTHKFKLHILKSKLTELQVKHQIEQERIPSKPREQTPQIRGKIKGKNRIYMIIWSISKYCKKNLISKIIKIIMTRMLEILTMKIMIIHSNKYLKISLIKCRMNKLDSLERNNHYKYNLAQQMRIIERKKIKIYT